MFCWPTARKIPPAGFKKAGARKLVSSLVSWIFDLQGKPEKIFRGGTLVPIGVKVAVKVYRLLSCLYQKIKSI